jgi:hypothetical protein
MYGALPYLFSKVAAELPLSVGLSCLFGGILYPLAKLGRTARKFRRFLGLTALNSVAASALGLLVGAVAPSTDAALAMFPPIIVLVRDPASLAPSNCPLDDAINAVSHTDDHFQRQQHFRRVDAETDQVPAEALAGPVLCGNQPVMAWKTPRHRADAGRPKFDLHTGPLGLRGPRRERI